jgi:hypothetical protein
MNYTKPAVAVLGEAVRVIEQLGKPYTPKQDGSPQFTTNPAYDLDE